MAADADIIATLASLEEAPKTFEACIELGPYIFRGLTPEERKTGTVRNALLVHVPGQCNKVSFMTCLTFCLTGQSSRCGAFAHLQQVKLMPGTILAYHSIRALGCSLPFEVESMIAQTA